MFLRVQPYSFARLTFLTEPRRPVIFKLYLKFPVRHLVPKTPCVYVRVSIACVALYICSENASTPRCSVALRFVCVEGICYCARACLLRQPSSCGEDGNEDRLVPDVRRVLLRLTLRLVRL